MTIRAVREQPDSFFLSAGVVDAVNINQFENCGITPLAVYCWWQMFAGMIFEIQIPEWAAGEAPAGTVG